MKKTTRTRVIALWVLASALLAAFTPAQAESALISASVTKLNIAISDARPDDGVDPYAKTYHTRDAASMSIVTTDRVFASEIDDGWLATDYFSQAEVVLGDNKVFSYTKPTMSYSEVSLHTLPTVSAMASTYVYFRYELGAYTTITLTGLAKNRSFDDLAGVTNSVTTQLGAYTNPHVSPTITDTLTGAGSSWLSVTYTNNTANPIEFMVGYTTMATITLAPTMAALAVPEPANFLLMAGGLLTVLLHSAAARYRPR